MPGFLALCLCLLSAVFAAEPPSIHQQLLPALRSRVKAQLSKPLDNLTGGIAWGAAADMQSLLECYRASHNREFLDLYLQLADAVVNARADIAGVRDWKGDLRKGWLTGGYYTLSVPKTLLDASGSPSLELQATANAGNDTTLFEIIPGPNGTFTLTVEYTFRRAEPLRERFDGITMDSAEAKVNGAPGAATRVRVRRIGNSPPRRYEPFRVEPAKVVLHGHHTGLVAAPLAAFAALVKADAQLSAYRPAATRHLRCAEEAMADANTCWRERDDYGHMIFEKGIPFWCDGVPEPHNVLSSTGSAYLALHDATGKPEYRRRAQLLARRIQLGLDPLPDGAWMHYYWWGPIHTGWTPSDAISVNTPLYKAAKHVEDTSHFQLTVRFIAECFERKVLFTRSDMERLAATFHRKIFKPEGPTLADRIDGTFTAAPTPQLAGRFNRNFAGFACLGRFDPTVAAACRKLAEARFPIKPVMDSTLLASWSALR